MKGRTTFKKGLFLGIIVVIGIILYLVNNRILQLDPLLKVGIMSHDTIDSFLIFEETFEDEHPFYGIDDYDIGEWDYALQIVNGPAFKGERSARFEIRLDQPLVARGKRSEVSIVRGADGDIGRDVWYSFAVLCPAEGYAFDKNREVINQWFQSGSPATSLRTDEDQFILETGNHPDNRRVISIAPIKKDSWHTFVFHFIHSYESDGLIELWFDGNKVISHKGGNMYDDILPRWKLGLYKAGFKYNTTDVEKRIIYFDNIRVGDKGAGYSRMDPNN